MKTLNYFWLIIALLQLNLLAAQTARVQVIHNSADAAADSVDVYLNDSLLLDNFAFRNATEFIDAPADAQISIDVAPKNSASSTESIYNLTTTLASGETYVLVASGIVSASGYDPATAFNIDVFDLGREMATNNENTDVLVYHGSTDAPNVAVHEKTAGELLKDIAYGEFAGYLELMTADYVLEIKAGEQVSSTVATYEAPLSTLGLSGSAITVVASGFLSPDYNSEGPGFGLYAALATGGELVELQEYVEPTARVQVIHNSADAAAASVDVWLNDTPLLTDFNFREATPFIDAPAGMDFDITIQPAGSTDTLNPVAKFTYNLAEGETYILVANGIVSASGYDPATAFNIEAYNMGREMASTAGNTDVLVYHGSTDAPVVDIYEKTAGELYYDLAYSEFSGYLELATADYVIEVRDETGENVVAAYEAPLSTLDLTDSAITVLASGFLNPANNSDGAAFGLYVALANGGNLIELPLYTSISPAIEWESMKVYPNPVHNELTVDLNYNNSLEVSILNVLGQVVYTLDYEAFNKKQTIRTSGLEQGVYLLRVSTGDKQRVVKFHKK